MYDSLDNILLDEEVIIKRVDGNDKLKRRLLDLGFLPDVTLKCVLISPFKDPKAYQINGTIIALRNKEAKNIEVEYDRY